MCASLSLKWQVEFIPDSDKNYRRVHSSYFRENQLTAGAFSHTNGSMSTDWSKYSTPKDSLNRAKFPLKNGVVSLVTADLRSINLQVIHAPSQENQAHTNVFKVDEEVRLKLLDMFTWEIVFSE